MGSGPWGAGSRQQLSPYRAGETRCILTRLSGASTQNARYRTIMTLTTYESNPQGVVIGREPINQQQS